MHDARGMGLHRKRPLEPTRGRPRRTCTAPPTCTSPSRWLCSLLLVWGNANGRWRRVFPFCSHARPERPCPGKRKPRVCRASWSGRYWARTSDPQLVDTEQTFAVCSLSVRLPLQNRAFHLVRVRTRSLVVHAGRAHCAHGTSLTFGSRPVVHEANGCQSRSMRCTWRRTASTRTGVRPRRRPALRPLGAVRRSASAPA